MGYRDQTPLSKSGELPLLVISQTLTSKHEGMEANLVDGAILNLKHVVTAAILVAEATDALLKLDVMVVTLEVVEIVVPAASWRPADMAMILVAAAIVAADVSLRPAVTVMALVVEVIVAPVKLAVTAIILAVEATAATDALLKLDVMAVTLEVVEIVVPAAS
ncbi:hypothetical protein BDY19DRAFT_990325 [Irpex rosettiformis]|uniref:Uncharacterized protein n=1 Tax=Irpex rosettiformis TaxID=378272 RepID=A0ACB8UEA6_9APHY|nr:hypothetical protein BDY19DRAFT_990325 [Irpex rosettiformis]